MMLLSSYRTTLNNGGSSTGGSNPHRSASMFLFFLPPLHHFPRCHLGLEIHSMNDYGIGSNLDLSLCLRRFASKNQLEFSGRKPARNIVPRAIHLKFVIHRIEFWTSKPQVFLCTVVAARHVS